MGCNCATVEQLDELYRVYGEKTQAKKPVGFWKNTVFVLRQTLLILLAIPATVFLALFLIWTLFWNKKPVVNVQKIHLLKLLKIIK